MSIISNKSHRTQADLFPFHAEKLLMEIENIDAFNKTGRATYPLYLTLPVFLQSRLFYIKNWPWRLNELTSWKRTLPNYNQTTNFNNLPYIPLNQDSEMTCVSPLVKPFFVEPDLALKTFVQMTIFWKSAYFALA